MHSATSGPRSTAEPPERLARLYQELDLDVRYLPTDDGGEVTLGLRVANETDLRTTYTLRTAPSWRSAALSGACWLRCATVRCLITDRASELVLNGDGGAVRDFVHVADMAAAFVLALHACQPGIWRPYNVGSGRASTVGEVIHTVETVTSRPTGR